MWRTVQVWSRRALLAFGTLALGVASVAGIAISIQVLQRSPSWSGVLQSLPQTACTGLGILCIVTTFRFRSWQAPALLAWVAACTFTAGVVPVLRGGTGWLGALSGGSAVLGASGFIALVQRAGSPAVRDVQPNQHLERRA